MSRTSPNVTNGVGVQTINQSADFVERKFAGSRSLSAADRVAARFFDIKGELRLTNQEAHGVSSSAPAFSDKHRMSVAARRRLSGPNGGIAPTARVWLCPHRPGWSGLVPISLSNGFLLSTPGCHSLRPHVCHQGVRAAYFWSLLLHFIYFNGETTWDARRLVDSFLH